MSQKKDIYLELTEKAHQYEFLHHFTSMEKFRSIVSSGKLLLNRLDRVEDKSENEYLDDFWKSKVFVLCCTHSSKGKIKFWNDYAKGNGVRIDIPNHLLSPDYYKIVSDKGYYFPKKVKTNFQYNSYSNECDWAIYDISKLDMLYIDPKNATEWINQGNGLIKNCVANDSYDWEEETRVRVAMEPLGISGRNGKYPIPPFQVMYMELSKELLSNLTIAIPRGSSDLVITQVQEILALNEHTKSCKIIYSMG